MLHRFILKVTKFQFPKFPKRLSTVVKNILGTIMPLPCQIGLNINPSCTKVFGTYTFDLQKGGWGVSRPPMISKTVDSTNFNFGRQLGLSMRGKKPVELMI